jgi:hypothetical protein
MTELEAWLRDEFKDVRAKLEEVLRATTALDIHRRANQHRVDRLEKGALWVAGLTIAAVAGALLKTVL